MTMTYPQAVEVLRAALKKAEAVIKGREHTGFIDKALRDTANLAPSSKPVGYVPSDMRRNTKKGGGYFRIFKNEIFNIPVFTHPAPREVQAVPEVVREALDIALDLANAEAERVHEAYKGYKPDRHAAVDADVKTVKDAIAAIAAAPKAPAQAQDATTK